MQSLMFKRNEKAIGSGRLSAYIQQQQKQARCRCCATQRAAVLRLRRLPGLRKERDGQQAA